jgi:hypothetical protein
LRPRSNYQNATSNRLRRDWLKASAHQRRQLWVELTRSALWTGNRLDAAERLLRAAERIADLELLAALADEAQGAAHAVPQSLAAD